MGKRVLRAVLWGILITFLGAFTAANVGENVIFTLLLYLLLVVSIFGVLILTKLSRCLLYNFVPVNHLWKRSEPFARQNDASSKNGVAGSTGSTTPTAPIPIERKPKSSHTIRTGFFFIFFIIFPFLTEIRIIMG